MAFVDPFDYSGARRHFARADEKNVWHYPRKGCSKEVEQAAVGAHRPVLTEVLGGLHGSLPHLLLPDGAGGGCGDGSPGSGEPLSRPGRAGGGGGELGTHSRLKNAKETKRGPKKFFVR